MQDNIVIVDFKDDITATTRQRHQYDKGQRLKFVDVSDGSQVEFSNENHDKAEPYIVKDSQVEIPDFLLKENSPITAYIKVVDKNSETTIKTVTIPVKSRPEADDDVPPENQQTFKQQMQEIMTDTKEIAQSVRDDANDGKFTPVKDVDYRDGKDGISPTITPTELSTKDGYRIDIEDINGVKNIILKNGKDGHDYVLTEEDLRTIAELVDLSEYVPVTRKVGSQSLKNDIGIYQLMRELGTTPEFDYFVKNNTTVQEVLKFATRTKSWRKIRTIVVPGVDAVDSTVDGVTFSRGYPTTVEPIGVCGVYFNTDENGNAFAGRNITALDISFTIVHGVTNVNQGFLVTNSNNVLYFTGPKLDATYNKFGYQIAVDSNTMNNMQISTNTGMYQFNRHKVDEIKSIQFKGHENTSILGEGAVLEFWAYGYWDDLEESEVSTDD